MYIPLTDTYAKGSCARAELHAAYKSCLSEIPLAMSLKMFSVAVLSSVVVAVVLGQDDGIRCGECIMEMHRFGFVDSLDERSLQSDGNRLLLIDSTITEMHRFGFVDCLEPPPSRPRTS